MLALQDAETGEKIVVDTSIRRVRTEYKQHAREKIEERHRLLRSTNVDAIDVFTDRPYTESLMKFFRLREKRLPS